MEISHNPKLRALEFPLVTGFRLNRGKLIIQNNSALQILSWPSLERFSSKELQIAKNPSLEIIEFDGPGTKNPYRSCQYFININGTMKIEDNQALREVTINKREPVQKAIVKRMVIRNNRRLESVPYTFTNNNIEMRIEGNPKLERKLLEELRKAANDSWGRIQDYGECILTEEVKELSLLNDCIYIYGNLTLAEGATGRVSSRLIRVEGNVYSSDVPLDRLEFLLNADIYGQFESALCDFDYSQFKAAKKGIRKSCSTREVAIETTTASSRRTEKTTTRATPTEKETVETTKMRVGTTAGIVINEQTETAAISTKMEETVTEEALTISTNQFIPITDKLMELSTPSEQKSKKNDAGPKIVLICAIFALVVFIIGLIAFFCHKKSKKKKKREESCNKSCSSKDSSSRPRVDSMKKSP